jgi:hypothetical protein
MSLCAAQAAHDAAAAELQELRRSAAAGQAATEGDAAAVKAADEAAYAAEHAELAKQVRCCASGWPGCTLCNSCTALHNACRIA